MLVLCCLGDAAYMRFKSITPPFIQIHRCTNLNFDMLHSLKPNAIITEFSFPEIQKNLELLNPSEKARCLILAADKDNISEIIKLVHSGIHYYSCHHEKKEILDFLISCSLDSQNSQNPDFSDNLGLIGNSQAIKNIRKNIKQFAPYDDTVLILGETGTGKEIVAKAIHGESRRQGAFLCINCSALPEYLMESELFGVKKGAYTGASQNRIGYFQAAHGGSLFLDEIGDMPLFMQTKLLRLLENKEITPLGSTVSCSCNVRIISATSADLKEMSLKKLFRNDLLYRLNILTLKLPPLRERPEDIILLAQYFLSNDSPEKELHPDSLMKLLKHSWPGNVRELKSVIRNAIIRSEKKEKILKEHISFF